MKTFRMTMTWGAAVLCAGAVLGAEEAAAPVAEKAVEAAAPAVEKIAEAQEQVAVEKTVAKEAVTRNAPEAATDLKKFGTFVPAFTEEVLDYDKCMTFVGKASVPVDFWQVRRTLGLIPTNGNWQHHIWTAKAAEGSKDSKETAYAFLIVLKKPVEVGTLSVSPADLATPSGSINGGELYYMKGDVEGDPDPVKDGMWTKVAFAEPAQHLRFGTLPKGTMVKALLYRDVRAKGDSQLVYLNAYKNRFADLVASAKGVSHPDKGVKNENGLAQGKGWSINVGDAVVTPKDPIQHTLVWEKKQKLNGLFLYSNAETYRVLAYTGDKPDPAKAPAKEWKEVGGGADWDNIHSWEGWHYFYRWISFPEVETSAIRVEITGVADNGKNCWITGLAAMSVVKE